MRPATIAFLILPLLGLAWAQDGEINGADTAWMLISTALVLFMTPALAFFYGGLVRQKNVLNTMMMSLAAIATAGVAWAVVGYSLSFGGSGGFIGGLMYSFADGIDLGPQDGLGFPELLFLAYQGTFAIITTAILTGSIVDRMRFGPLLVFLTLWSLLVYAPIAHWVWGGGFLGAMGALDFAGGTVVHVNAGIAGLVAAWVLGSRREWGHQALLPHNVPFTILGAALLWLGWFGFNGGSAFGANETAALALVNTMLAPAATLLVWMVLDYWRTGQATAVGAATAIVVGLVAVTPAAGFVGPASALAIGAIAAFPSYFLIMWRSGTGLDDSLDVFAAHGIGGATGALLTGVFAQSIWNSAGSGALDGNWGQVWIQVQTIVVAGAYSAVATGGLLWIIGRFAPLRASPEEESLGMDVTQHGEEAYGSGEGAILVIEEERGTRK